MAESEQGNYRNGLDQIDRLLGRERLYSNTARQLAGAAFGEVRRASTALETVLGAIVAANGFLARASAAEQEATGRADFAADRLNADYGQIPPGTPLEAGARLLAELQDMHSGPQNVESLDHTMGAASALLVQATRAAQQLDGILRGPDGTSGRLPRLMGHLDERYGQAMDISAAASQQFDRQREQA